MVAIGEVVVVGWVNAALIIELTISWISFLALSLSESPLLKDTASHPLFTAFAFQSFAHGHCLILIQERDMLCGNASPT